MKNKILLLNIIVLALLSQSSVYGQDIEWEKSYGGMHADYLMDAIPTPDYGFILAGSSLSNKTGTKSDNNKGDLDYWVWKMNEKGELDWQKSFGGSGSDFLQSIALTIDGGFILGGVSSSPQPSPKEREQNNHSDKNDACRGGDDFWIIKLDAKGNQEWQKTIGGSGQEKLQTIKQTKDGGYIIGGSSSSYKSGDKSNDTYGNQDYWIVKLDDKGKIEWQQSYGGIYQDELRSMEQTRDGGYILGGYSNSPVSGNKSEDNKGIGDYWIIKLDKKGEITWQKTIGGNKDDQLYVVHQAYDGNYIVGGNSNSESSNEKSRGNESGTDFWVLKLGQDGEILWQETYNIGKVDILTSLVENDDHSLLLGGFAKGEIAGSRKQMAVGKKWKDAVLRQAQDDTTKKGTGAETSSAQDYVAIKVSEKGEELWRRAVGSAGEDLLKKAIETRDGGYLMAGVSSPDPSKGGENAAKLPSRDKQKGGYGSNDFWVVKLKDSSKPKKVKATIEAFPNPSFGFTNVYVGYEFETGTATVVDMAGRQLQQFEITSRTVPVDLSAYPDGIYVINIKTNVQSDGVKVIKGSDN